MKILILGATGFIGGHIAKEALKIGWEVWGLRRDEDRVGHLAGLPVKWVLGDLMDLHSLANALDGMDAIFHAAAFYPKSGHPSRIPEQLIQAKQETENIICAVKGSSIKRVIFTSSLTTIGHPPHHDKRLADERDFYIPGTLSKSGYYETKIVIEKMLIEACKNGIPSIILNPTAVFGPADVHMSMGGLLVAVARGWMIGWLPGEINVVDVRDVAAAHIAAVAHGEIGERYIIGGHNYSVKDALFLTAQVTGAQKPKLPIPLWLLKSLVLLGDIFPSIPLPINHLRAVHLWQGYNTTKAVNDLGFTPRPFEETIVDSINWFRENDYF